MPSPHPTNHRIEHMFYHNHNTNIEQLFDKGYLTYPILAGQKATGGYLTGG